MQAEFIKKLMYFQNCTQENFESQAEFDVCRIFILYKKQSCFKAFGYLKNNVVNL